MDMPFIHMGNMVRTELERQGKTIAWLAKRLINYSEINTVIVISDRTVIDGQLGTELMNVDGKKGVAQHIENTSQDLLKKLTEGGYIIVTTLCNKEEIANKIIDTLLEKKLIVGSQVTKVHSKYWWNNKLEECDEYKLEFRTKETIFNEIENEIKQIHDYEVAEISYYEIKNASREFFDWIDKNIL